MKQLMFAACVLFAIACGKSDSKPAAKATDPEPAKAEPAKVEPKAVKPEPAKAEVKADAKPAPANTASDADKKLVAGVGESAKLDFKTSTGDFLTLTVKQRVQDGKYVTDVLDGGKVLETIASGVEKDDIHMEVKSAINIALGEGVLVVVSAIKVTGKPADYYMGRVYKWDATAKKLKLDRKIEFDQVYDPAIDGN